MKQAMQLLTSSETTEWYTPAVYIEAAREVLGKFDLDPASCDVANEWIQADYIYTKENDGLQHSWIGRIFMNPPFGYMGQKLIRHLCAQFDLGNVKCAILLTKCVPGYKWWDALFHDRKFPVCFVRDRIAFLRVESGKVIGDGVSKAGSNFWYFGEDADKFEVVFSQFGRVIRE